MDSLRRRICPFLLSLSTLRTQHATAVAKIPLLTPTPTQGRNSERARNESSYMRIATATIGSTTASGFPTINKHYSSLSITKSSVFPPTLLSSLKGSFASVSFISQVRSRANHRAFGRKMSRKEDDVNWDTLGFKPLPTDYMYVMKCSESAIFCEGELHPFGNIEMSPASGVLNYGQGVFEGLKAYKKEDGSILLFRPEENALRLKMGADRMCMPSPTIEQFMDAIKLTVLANKRWIPPSGKGALYIRPLLVGSGAVLTLEPSSEYTFLVYATPVGNYFKGLVPIHLLVETEVHRAAPGGTGCVKTIGNYASVLKTQLEAKAKGFSDVLYIDPVHRKYLEEVSSCNIFIVKDKVISTPALNGTILPGITRKSIIELARTLGYEVVERLVSVEELQDADEVFCTGTAVVVSPVGSVTHLGKRIEYGNEVGVVAQQLYSTLTNLQKGLIEDNMGWTVELKFEYKTGALTVSQKLYKMLTGIQTGLLDDKMGWTISMD